MENKEGRYIRYLRLKGNKKYFNHLLSPLWDEFGIDFYEDGGWIWVLKDDVDEADKWNDLLNDVATVEERLGGRIRDIDVGSIISRYSEEEEESEG